MTRKILFSFIIAIIFSVNSKAQVDKNSDLYKVIISKDSLLFNVGFNTCNIKQFEILVSENLNFFHDKSGFSDSKKFFDDLRNGLCRSTSTYLARRELLSESTEIYALYNKGHFTEQSRKEYISSLKNNQINPRNSEAQPSLHTSGF